MRTLLLTLCSGLLLIGCGVAKNPTLQVNVIPERSYVVASDEQELVFSIDLLGCSVRPNKRHPLNLALVLDRSGSMRGAKLEQAKQAAILVVDQLQSKDTFSLVAYDTQVDVLIPAQHVRNKKQIRSAIRNLGCGGSTALHAGVKAGAQELREYFDEEKVNRVILLSDGIANVGPRTPAELARLGQRLIRESIHVTTVGLGDDYNEDLMVSLAEASAANYYYVQDIETLPTIFAEELGYLRNVVARNIRIRIELPDGVTPIEILGHPEIRFKGNTAELKLNDYYAGQERQFLVRCQVKNVDGTRIRIAKVQTDYSDEVAGSSRSDEFVAYVDVTTDRKKADTSLNKKVAKQASWYRNLASRVKALALVDAKKPEEAAQVLRAQASANDALPGELRDSKLDQETDSLLSNAKLLESEGSFDRRSRKEFQYDNYRQKNQK
ncbi:MAG: VWA domain-containing protein [Verrucomicrobiota bacterium]